MRLFLFLLLIPAVLPAQPANLTGHWFAVADFYGSLVDFPLELTQQGDKLTGNFDGDKLEGTLTGNAIHFLAKDDQGGSEQRRQNAQRCDGVSGHAFAEDLLLRQEQARK